MQAMLLRIFLILFVLVLIHPSSLLAKPGERIALVIGNGAYSSGPLKNPVNDATDIASALKQAGFTVTLKKNANLQEMLETIEDFGNSLKRGGVGLFYYAGHGVQVNGVNYLLPINAKINKESDVRFQAVDTGRVLAEMENANNSLNIVILDACRDNPFGKSFRSASRGLAIVANAPSGTFISYSTGAGQVANDGEGKNSPYTKALLENLTKPGLTINKVFMNVRSKVKKETGQVPWELSSLETDFFFVPGSGNKEAEITQPRKTITDSLEPSTARKSRPDAFDDESRKLDDEELKWEKETAALAKKNLTVVMGKRPPVPKANEIKRDGRFIAYDNGTVLDTSTNLMWAAKDNGSDISWRSARSYCENYRVGGYTDWRMPTMDELEALYDTGKSYRSECTLIFSGWDLHLTELIRLTCYAPWASATRGSDAATIIFHRGTRHWYPQSFVGTHSRALPVRSDQ